MSGIVFVTFKNNCTFTCFRFRALNFFCRTMNINSRHSYQRKYFSLIGRLQNDLVSTKERTEEDQVQIGEIDLC